MVAAVATTAEDAGFDSLWVMDHVAPMPAKGVVDPPMFEAYTLLGGLAARTRRARLGALVSSVTDRHPALLAKEVTALDVLSGGRAVLGIGAARSPTGHVDPGAGFPSLTERFARLEEGVRICRLMFTEDSPSFEGRHYRVHDAVNRPRPRCPGGPPILIGGNGERRTLRLVAELADACNLLGDADTIRHKLSVLARHCDEVGRDPTTVTTTRLGTLVVARSANEVERRLGDLRTSLGADEEHLRAMVTAGQPEAVIEQVAALFATGVDGLIFTLPDAHDLDAVALAGQTLSGAFGRRDTDEPDIPGRHTQ